MDETLSSNQVLAKVSLTPRAEELTYGALRISNQCPCSRNFMENFIQEILTLCSR